MTASYRFLRTRQNWPFSINFFHSKCKRSSLRSQNYETFSVIFKHCGTFWTIFLRLCMMSSMYLSCSRYTFLRNLLCFAYWKQIVHTQATLNTLWQKPNFRPKNTLWQIASEASYVYIWVDKSSLKKPNWNIVFFGQLEF